ncbi:S8 family serine peptidase [Catenulispora sp. NF23]|uniref:S8 family serine peptidase n=1 Tax=Catenulispora pinistramenti TaxID=2705254 RepID=A0ABS5KZN2_9ACTN|nr:S8 family serine peptidase [Catenulispora pinistramenti]MBS2537422.1 S8 family serine peptidase [Catenulispora pinistramenti]MBS2551455.1 S8 family serine peptidase [Catenulispora pinistramenti]
MNRRAPHGGGARALAAGGAVAALVAGLVVAPIGGAPTAAADTCQPSVTAVPQTAAVPWAQTALRYGDLAPYVAPAASGARIKVAVVDSGIDVSAPQLAGAVDVQDSVSLVNPATYPPTADALGHGTMVAGIIAARARAGVAVVGMAPSVVSLLSIRTYQVCESEDAPIAAGILQAVQRGAKIINVSAGSPTDTPDMASAVRTAQAAGVLIVAAAGNLGAQQDGDPLQYPAAYPGVIAVAAVGSDRTAAPYSEHGADIGLAAPGGTSDAPLLGVGPAADGTLASGMGTSFAAPYVTAAAALVWNRYPSLTAAQVRQRLYETADRVAADAPDHSYGWGIVDPYAALTSVAAPAPATSAPPVPAAPLTFPVVSQRPDLTGRTLAVGGGGLLSAGGVAGVAWLARRRKRDARLTAARSALTASERTDPGTTDEIRGERRHVG